MLKTLHLRPLLAATLAATALFCTAEQVNVVTVSTADGNKIHFASESEPHAYFSNEEMTLKFNKLPDGGAYEINYPLSDFKSLSVGKQDKDAVTGIDTTDASQELFSITNDAITACGLKPGSKLTAHAVNGILVGIATVTDNGSAVIPLGNAPEGTIIVKSNLSTFKFTR